MSGFGRKGLDAGQGEGLPRQSPGFGQVIPAQRMPPQPAYDPVAAQREAFIAAERARRMSEPEQRHWADSAQTAPGLTGYAQRYPSSRPAVYQSRSLAVAYILWFILGQLSVHRFYLGATTSAIVQVSLFFGSLITLLIFLPMGAIGFVVWILWILADVFLMPGLHRQFCRPPASAGIFS